MRKYLVLLTVFAAFSAVTVEASSILGGRISAPSKEADDAALDVSPAAGTPKSQADESKNADQDEKKINKAK